MEISNEQVMSNLNNIRDELREFKDELNERVSIIEGSVAALTKVAAEQINNINTITNTIGHLNKTNSILLQRIEAIEVMLFSTNLFGAGKQ